jgi:hypothetical protein
MKKLFFLYFFVCLFPVFNCLGQRDTTAPVPFAGVSMENPTGLGGYFGTIGIGMAVQSKTRAGSRPDGNSAIYMAWGDPVHFVGIGTSLSINGLSNRYGTHDNIGESGFNLDISRLLFNVLFLKAGVYNAAFWGKSKESLSAQRSFYGAGTVFWGFNGRRPGTSFSYIAFTVGAGNGLFRNGKNFTPGHSGNFNPFVSIALPVLPRINTVLEWTGEDITTGIASNITLFKTVPLSVNLEVTDYLLGKLRYVTSVGCGFNLLKKRKYEKR